MHPNLSPNAPQVTALDRHAPKRDWLQHLQIPMYYLLRQASAQPSKVVNLPREVSETLHFTSAFSSVNHPCSFALRWYSAMYPGSHRSHWAWPSFAAYLPYSHLEQLVAALEENEPARWGRCEYYRPRPIGGSAGLVNRHACSNGYGG